MAPCDVLVIAPHPDDEAIGCGGMIRAAADAGQRVGVIFLTSGERGVAAGSSASPTTVREEEARLAGDILGVAEIFFIRGPDGSLLDAQDGVAEKLASEIADLDPARVYLPHPGDEHPDHAVALSIVRASFDRAAAERPWLIGFEVWSPLPKPEWISDITREMPAKLHAVRQYRSQLATFRYDRAVEGLNAFRGELGARKRFAEAFMTL